MLNSFKQNNPTTHLLSSAAALANHLLESRSIVFKALESLSSSRAPHTNLLLLRSFSVFELPVFKAALDWNRKTATKQLGTQFG